MAPAGLMASGMVPWLKPVDRTEYEARFGLPPFEDRGSGYHLAILSRHQPATQKSCNTSENTIIITKPLDIQCWFRSLHVDSGLAWTTISKMRGVMSRIYKVGMLHDRVSKNPVLNVETRAKTNYRPIVITPAQTFGILKSLANLLHFTLVLTCAATALRSSEILALRWADILWDEEKIRVSKRWAKGEDGETKTDASDGYVPLHPVLAGHLRAWQRQTPHTKATDFVFPSMRADGRKPLCSSVFVADHL